MAKIVAAMLLFAIVGSGCRRDKHREAVAILTSVGTRCYEVGKGAYDLEQQHRTGIESELRSSDSIPPSPSDPSGGGFWKSRGESPFAPHARNRAQAGVRSSANGRAIACLISASSGEGDTMRQLASVYDKASGQFRWQKLPERTHRLINDWGGGELLNNMIGEGNGVMFHTMRLLGLHLIEEGHPTEGILALAYAQAGGDKGAASDLRSFADNKFEFVLPRIVRNLSDPSVPLPKLLDALDITIEIFNAFEPPDLHVPVKAR